MYAECCVSVHAFGFLSVQFEPASLPCDPLRLADHHGIVPMANKTFLFGARVKPPRHMTGPEGALEFRPNVVAALQRRVARCCDGTKCLPSMALPSAPFPPDSVIGGGRRLCGTLPRSAGRSNATPPPPPLPAPARAGHQGGRGRHFFVSSGTMVPSSRLIAFLRLPPPPPSFCNPSPDWGGGVILIEKHRNSRSFALRLVLLELLQF